MWIENPPIGVRHYKCRTASEIIIDEKHLHKKVTEFIEHCLNRYFGELYGLTPKQVLEGALPDKHRFTPPIQEARLKRIEANKQFAGCNMPN